MENTINDNAEAAKEEMVDEEVQTEIDMENLEKLLNQTLRKNESKDSRASNKNSNNS